MNQLLIKNYSVNFNFNKICFEKSVITKYSKVLDFENPSIHLENKLKDLLIEMNGFKFQKRCK